MPLSLSIPKIYVAWVDLHRALDWVVATNDDEDCFDYCPFAFGTVQRIVPMSQRFGRLGVETTQIFELKFGCFGAMKLLRPRGVSLLTVGFIHIIFFHSQQPKAIESIN